MNKTDKEEYENKMRNDLKPMRNASFLRLNDGNTMRNAVFLFYFTLYYVVDLQIVIVRVMRT